MEKKISDFEKIKELLENSTSTEEITTKMSREDLKILKEATGVDFTETFEKIGALKD